MKTRKALVAALLFSAPLHAQVFETYSFSPNLAIPDGNATGVSDVQSVASAGTSIVSLRVNLNIVGDFNGDLHIYLRHNTGRAVLLNQVGVTSGNSFGYDDDGFNITLRDDAANDIHLYRDFTPTPASGTQLTGNWQPDGRVDDPLGARTALLDRFQGVDPNGQWTLFAADLSNDGNSTIQSWGMEMTVVPEPKGIALVAGVALAGFGLWRRLRKS